MKYLFNSEVYPEIKASSILKGWKDSPPEGKKCLVTISFIFQGNDTSQKILVDLIPSSLGKGWIALFICPVSRKRCRKLYLINGVYQHCLNVKNYYPKLNPFKYNQPEFYRICMKAQAKANFEKMINRPFFRKYYNGKPTKAYLKGLRILKDSGSYNLHNLVNGKYDFALK